MKIFYKFLVIIAILFSCSNTKEKTGDSEDIIDSAFYVQVKETIFAFDTDATMQLKSDILKIDYIDKKIKILIDTLNEKELAVIESHLNDLVFENSNESRGFFKYNKTPLKKTILNELSKNYKNADFLNLISFYEADNSVKNVADKFLYLNDNNNYDVDEPAIHEYFQYNKEKAKDVFPIIIEEYELSFLAEVIMASYLYKLGNKSYLLKINDRKLNQQQKSVLEFYERTLHLNKN